MKMKTKISGIFLVASLIVAVVVLGQAVPVQIANGQLHLDISVTTVFIESVD
jgi:hypothetical protein